MKKILYFLTITLVTASCMAAQDPTTEMHVDKYRPIEEPYVYDAFECKKTWESFTSFEEKLEACQVPESVVGQLTTEALIITCLNHPFAPIYSAYRSEFEIVKLLMEHNNAFKELAKRCDAAERLIDIYESDVELSRCQMHFLELLLGSGVFPDLYKEPLSIRLEAIAESRLALRRLMPDSYSIHSWKTAELLVTEVEKNILPDYDRADRLLKGIESTGTKVKTKTAGDYQGSTTVYTPYGSSITGYYFEDYDSSEKAEQDAFYCSLFPSAILQESSTYDYNENSYATNMALGGPTCWIGSISSYLLDGVYMPTDSSFGVDLVYFPSQDFPAEATMISGTVISKWSNGPLMRHTISDCPYALSSPEYYIFNKKIISVSGPDMVNPSTTVPYTYSESHNFGTAPGGSFIWTVDGPNELSSDYTMSVSGSQMNIVFNDTGEYNIWCRYYFAGIEFGVGSRFVLSVNGRVENVDEEEE